MTCTLNCAGFFRARSETLEDRLLLAGDLSVADSRVSHGVAAHFASAKTGIDSEPRQFAFPSEVHALSVLSNDPIANVRDRFKLDGEGQTVAVIDSGIAFDHDALGGGYGSDHRVVGGWDFTEPLDRSPYDDAPVGLHGTHVAGIIGSSDDKHPGIAPGVDFVALRVFDDRGYSRIDWLEGALQWVHEHRTSFEHPITTVNLSVRFDDAVSDDQLLRIEDELKALYEDNIFVAVAAGNDFSNQSPFELGYPAASASVVPVGSVNSENQISRFSQRNHRILAAPGESITSTAPDHIENVNGRTDDFYTITGTSMAAPYAAGASVLVRQAMQQTGRLQITQTDIYDHLRDTADLVRDPVTGLRIPVINIERAIDTLIEEATPDETASNGSDATSPISGIDLTAVRDLGTVDFERIELSGGGHTLRIAASQDGTMTIVADGNRAEFRVYDAASRRLVAESNRGRIDLQVQRGSELLVHAELITDTTVRIANLVATSENSINVNGSSNADEVSVDDDSVSVNGISYQIDHDVRSIYFAESNGRDTLEVATSGDADIRIAGVTVNEIDRTITSNTFEEIVVLHDDPTRGSVVVTGSGGDDIVGVSPGRVALRGDRFRFVAEGFANYQINANGGSRDRIRLEGTTGRAHVSGTIDEITFSTSTVNAIASGFDQIAIESVGNEDTAELEGTMYSDTVYASPNIVRYSTGGKSIFLRDFENVSIDGAGGADIARLVGSKSNDTFNYSEAGIGFETPEFQFSGIGFETVSVYGRAGNDTSHIRGSAQSDRFDVSSNSVFMENQTSYVAVQQFEFNTVETDRRGNDSVFIEDSSGDDSYIANDKFARMSGDGYQNVARGFAHVIATSRNGGIDRASLFDSMGDDSLFSSSTRSYMIGDNFRNEIAGFAQTTIRSNRGNDHAMLNVAADQQVTGESNRLKLSAMQTGAKESILIGFDEIQANVDANTSVHIATVDYIFSLQEN